jgi:hypothetical protein
VISEFGFVESVEVLDVTCSRDIGLLRVEGKAGEQIGIFWRGVAGIVL